MDEQFITVAHLVDRKGFTRTLECEFPAPRQLRIPIAQRVRADRTVEPLTEMYAATFEYWGPSETQGPYRFYAEYREV